MTTTTPTKEAPVDTIAAALAVHRGATAAELAEAAGIGRSTAAKALAAMEREGTAYRTPGGRDDGRRLPDRWRPVGTSAAVESSPDEAPALDEVGVVPSDGAPAASAPGGDDGAETAGATRLSKGALRSLAFDYLAEHAGPDGLGPAAVAKGLGGRSSGAVGNALARLQADGRVRLASESPRRYITVG